MEIKNINYKRITKNQNHINYNIYAIYNILLFFILISFPISLENEKLFKLKKLNSYSEIILTIKGSGNKQIINNKTNNFYHEVPEESNEHKFDTKPSELFVNGEKVKEDFYVYNLEGEENIVTIRFNEKLKNCTGMFYELSDIIKIKFNHYDSSITNMEHMFYECEDLISLDLSDFDSSSVTSMYRMISSCYSLISVDLTGFVTSSVVYMNNMFCSNNQIKYLDVSSFDTSSVVSMVSMFQGCSSLISLNLSNFRTPLVERMNQMFYSCSNLISIDMSNFDTSKVLFMNGMFFKCSKLISLDLSNFNTLSVQNMASMFNDCSSSLIYCINPNNAQTTDLLNHIKSTSTYSFKNNNLCSDTCFVENKKILYESRECALSCNEESKYDYKSICYSSCPDETYSNSDFICIKEPYESINTINNEIYTTIINEPTSYLTDKLTNKYESTNIAVDDKYTTIITESTDYVTDKITDKYESTNKVVDDKYTTIIIESTNYFIDKITNKDERTNSINDIDKTITQSTNYLTDKITNKYESGNSINFLSDTITNKFDIFQNNISTNIPIAINTGALYKTEIITFFSPKISDDLNHSDNYNISLVSIYDYIYYINNVSKLSNNSNSKDNIIITIREELIKGNLDIFIFNLIKKEKKDLIFKEDNIIYQLTSIYNQNNNEYTNISSIYLGECESILRNHYNISDNIPLLILKLDIYEEGFLIPIIEYEVYNSQTKQKLELDVCLQNSIIIYLPVIIDEKTIFKYNTSHEYYNDICYSYTTDNFTDIILKDRRDEYINNNMSLCEKNCKYNGYDFDTKKAICECLVKIKFPLLSEIVVNKEKFLNNFIDLKKQMNINVMKCYNNLFNKE